MTLQVVVMGVSGSGKSAVGERLAARLGWPFLEGDDLHPASNVAKMAAGEPLDDADRAPWLAAVAARLSERDAAGESSVTSCSALRRAYRDLLADAAHDVLFVALAVSPSIATGRMATREHFMPASLLASQLDTLEPLADDEDGVSVDADLPLDAVVAAARDAVDLRVG